MDRCNNTDSINLDYFGCSFNRSLYNTTKGKGDIMPEAKLFLDDVIKTALTPVMYNEVTTLAGVEYKKFIGKCLKFTFKARGGIFKISFTPLTSGVNYVQLADALSYNEDLIVTPSDFMIYFQSNTAGAVLEIVIWKGTEF